MTDLLVTTLRYNLNGAVAQLGEHLLCKQGVSGSIPLSSTKVLVLMRGGDLVFEEIKVCITLMSAACSAYIVKRRLIWRLPGAGFDPVSEPSPDDPCEGLAGLSLGKDWR